MVTITANNFIIKITTTAGHFNKFIKATLVFTKS